ncbi:sterol desaturase family protein [Parendozoicomonas haliclonae]|uniref:Fatty acid hydroxylase superfamily protein n=1 Tax=Parendozoicomonas haliclonae TaxID=1960125 RepID=A0A1X7AP32_9GAMM|nr:sterol desaturase family protein [Parendozoicomonas haliclonae]SMA48885.1 Fatty acid hydroxylase superfamily protein [Parendozoicomonas haliclonae]
MNPITYAIPAFMVLILIEVIATVIRKKDYYRLNDAINSLSCGMISITLKLVTNLGMYVLIYNNLALFTFDAASLWVWLAVLVLQDFCYYWNHRIGHEVNIFWASHSVHHQSEEYNLTTALRQTSTSFFLSWIFYVPLALLGFPPEVFFTVSLLNLLYQFWVHTRHIPKLGWYEWIFVTPSNHRVHHAKNLKYLDKNYGGLFILWDRLFGTFMEEDENYEPIRYGTIKPLRNWNPITANLSPFADLMHDAIKTKSWKEKFALWFRHTGYRPADVAPPSEMPDIHAYEDYDPAVSKTVKIYSGIQFALLVLATTLFMGISHTTSYAFDALWASLMAINLMYIGKLLENHSLPRVEFQRIGLTVCTLLITHWQWQLVPVSVWLAAAFWIALSAIMVFIATARTSQAAAIKGEA